MFRKLLVCVVEVPRGNRFEEQNRSYNIQNTETYKKKPTTVTSVEYLHKYSSYIHVSRTRQII